MTLDEAFEIAARSLIANAVKMRLDDVFNITIGRCVSAECSYPPPEHMEAPIELRAWNLLGRARREDLRAAAQRRRGALHRLVYDEWLQELKRNVQRDEETMSLRDAVEYIVPKIWPPGLRRHCVFYISDRGYRPMADDERFNKACRVIVGADHDDLRAILDTMPESWWGKEGGETDDTCD